MEAAHTKYNTHNAPLQEKTTNTTKYAKKNRKHNGTSSIFPERSIEDHASRSIVFFHVTFEPETYLPAIISCPLGGAMVVICIGGGKFIGGIWFGGGCVRTGGGTLVTFGAAGRKCVTPGGGKIGCAINAGMLELLDVVLAPISPRSCPFGVGIGIGGGRQVACDVGGGTDTLGSSGARLGGGTDLFGGGTFLMKSGSVIGFDNFGSSLGAGMFSKSIGFGLGISFKRIGDGEGIFCNCNGAGGGMVSVFIGSGCGMVWTGIGFGAGIEANSTVCIPGGGAVICD